MNKSFIVCLMVGFVMVTAGLIGMFCIGYEYAANCIHDETRQHVMTAEIGMTNTVYYFGDEYIEVQWTRVR